MSESDHIFLNENATLSRVDYLARWNAIRNNKDLILKTIKRTSESMTVEPLNDYDESVENTSLFFDTLVENELEHRENVSLVNSSNRIKHPTSELFRIGIASIRQKVPSESFLTLLEFIGSMAEDENNPKDVLSFILDGLPNIRCTTINAVGRDKKLVNEFRSFFLKKIDEKIYKAAKVKNVIGDHDAPREVKNNTYAKIMKQYKQPLSQDEAKVLDRALEKFGDDLIRYRDWELRTKK